MSKKVPQLRFNGYSDAWVQRKLGENATILTGGTPKTTEPSYWEPKEIPWMSSGEVNKKRLESTDNMISEIGLENSSARWVKEHSILIALAGQGKTRGMVAINNILLTTNQSIAAIEPNESLDYEFVFQNLGNRYDELRMSSSGDGTRGGLNKKIISDILVSAPDIDEQKQIGKLFANLDNLIAANQRKVDLLKEQKKGYLQKMFPKNGAKVPELRFAGFADAWEERKLSDVANHRGGTAIEKYFDKDGVYKVISIGSYGLNSQYVDQNIRAISNEITDGRVVNSGELTMVLNDKTANGTIIGRTLLVEKDNEYVINQRTEIISPKENFDSNFAYTILNGPFREKVKRIVQGGTQIYVNYPAVSNLNLELPKIEEQQKIGSFFKQLDYTIALHQRKLDFLKEQKKGLLQKMFV